MFRIHRALRAAAILLVTTAATACDIGSSLEPDSPDPAPKPPRIVKPKELTSIGTRMPEPLR